MSYSVDNEDEMWMTDEEDLEIDIRRHAQKHSNNSQFRRAMNTGNNNHEDVQILDPISARDSSEKQFVHSNEHLMEKLNEIFARLDNVERKVMDLNETIIKIMSAMMHIAVITKSLRSKLRLQRILRCEQYST